MKKLFLLPAFTLLTACPTPPENVPQGNVGNAPSNQPMGQPPGQPAGDNADNPTGQPPQGEGQPPQGEGQGEEQPPPEDGTAENGEGQPAENQPENEGIVPNPGDPPQAPEQDKPPEGGIVTDSLLIRVDRIPSTPPVPKHSQEEVGSGSHVTFTGQAVCSNCSEKLVLRAVRFIGPNASPSDNDVITQKDVEAGDFSILIPNSEEGVALELLVDSDKNGYPSAGERFAVIEMGGQLIPTADRTDLSLDASYRKIFKQAPPPGGTPGN